MHYHVDMPSSSSSRYVAITSDRLVATLEAFGVAVQDVGGTYSWSQSGRERIFRLHLHAGLPGVVAIYTSLGVGDEQVRPRGKDAVRILVGVLAPGTQKFVPTTGHLKWKKIMHRTAPKGFPSDRMDAFFARMRVHVRAAYKAASKIKRCPDCGSPMVARKSREGHEFAGCMGYPECKTTRSL